MSRGRYYLRQGYISLLVLFLGTVVYVTSSTAIDPHVLNSVRVDYQARRWHVVLTGSESMIYRSTKVSDPLRVVVDLPNTLNKTVPEPRVVDKGAIDIIRTEQLFHDPQPLTRVEITLNREASHKITRRGEEIWISFNTAQPVTEAEPTLIEPVVKPKAQQLPVTKEGATPKPSASKPVPSTRPSEKKSPPSASKILSIRQLKMDQEIRYYIIANGSLADYVAFHLTNPSRLVVDLTGVKSTAVTDALSFGGPWVKKVRFGLHTNKVRVVFDLIPEAGLPYQIVSGDDQLIISFKAGTGFQPR